MRTSLRPSMPLALAIALAMPGAFAEPASQPYQLPAQPLDQALREIARQSGRSIVADPALVRGRASHAVDGDFDAEAAARRALQGSGLQLRTTENGTLTVERTPEGDTLELGATTVNAAALGETTEGTGSYTTGALTIGKGAHTLKGSLLTMAATTAGEYVKEYEQIAKQEDLAACKERFPKLEELVNAVIKAAESKVGPA